MMFKFKLFRPQFSWKGLQWFGVIGLISWFVVFARITYEMIVHWPWYLESKYYLVAAKGHYFVLPDHLILNSKLLALSVITGVPFLLTLLLGFLVVRIVHQSGFDGSRFIFGLFGFIASMGCASLMGYTFIGLWERQIFGIFSPFMP